jgi:hypothetical protein
MFWFMRKVWIDVICLAVRGRSNRQMAGESFVSKDTVKTHLRHIYEEVGFSMKRSASPVGLGWLCSRWKMISSLTKNHPNGC